MSQPNSVETLPTLAYLLRLDDKIERLQQARKEALASAISEVSRATWTASEAREFRDYIRSRKVLGRGDLFDATKWTDYALRMNLRSPDVTPKTHFVYVLIGQDGPVYVGQSRRLSERLARHRKDKRIPFTRYEAHPCANEREARDLEAVLIQQHRPSFNIRIERRTA